VRAEEFEGAIEGGGVFEAQVDEEDILPRATVDRARLDLGEVEAGPTEGFERAEEGAGTMLQREGDAKFVSAGRSFGGRAYEGQEAGVVVGMVLDARDEDLCAVLSGGKGWGDAGRVAQTRGHEVLDAAGGVVERDGGDVRVGTEPVAALRERDGVREDLPDVRERDAGGGDDIVTDTEQALAGGDEVVGEEQVEVLGDRAVEAVLDGENGEVDGAGLDSFACLGGQGAGNDFEVETGVLRGHRGERGDVRIGAELALDRDLRCSFWL